MHFLLPSDGQSGTSSDHSHQVTPEPLPTEPVLLYPTLDPVYQNALHYGYLGQEVIYNSPLVHNPIQPPVAPPPPSDTSIVANTQSRPRPTPFVRKLFDLMNSGEHLDHIDWANGGRSIVVRRGVDFGSTVLSSRFRSTQIATFIRQLNGHGFRGQKQRKGFKLVDENRVEVSVYTHPFFYRNCEDLTLVTRAVAQLPHYRGSRRPQISLDQAWSSEHGTINYSWQPGSSSST